MPLIFFFFSMTLERIGLFKLQFKFADPVVNVACCEHERVSSLSHLNWFVHRQGEDGIWWKSKAVSYVTS